MSPSQENTGHFVFTFYLLFCLCLSVCLSFSVCECVCALSFHLCVCLGAQSQATRIAPQVPSPWPRELVLRKAMVCNQHKRRLETGPRPRLRTGSVPKTPHAPLSFVYSEANPVDSLCIRCDFCFKATHLCSSFLRNPRGPLTNSLTHRDLVHSPQARLL